MPKFQSHKNYVIPPEKDPFPEENIMRIAICASMIFAEKMIVIKRQLEEIGHEAFISQFAEGPELAMLERLSVVREAADLTVADKIFEAATNFRPEILHVLLRACSQVKAKRLFLWFSDRHGHDWLQALKIDGINLGKGKRMLVKGGAFDPTYQITIPREMAVAKRDGDSH
jgi:hypothetical protein